MATFQKILFSMLLLYMKKDIVVYKEVVYQEEKRGKYLEVFIFCALDFGSK